MTLLAPHCSGVYEVMIKAAKKAIYAILSSADVTDEELHSADAVAEGLINTSINLPIGELTPSCPS